jgi:hypothetical protein
MNKKGITIKTLAGLMFALSLCSTAQAQNRVFVSGAGDDLNPCTRAAPCRNFQRGHDAVASGGEVVALDSAGYGAVTINKSVSITGEGVYAGITAASGNGITIATAGITVNLRSLTIQGNGSGTHGVNVTAVDDLHVEGCVISGFTQIGINVDLAADGSRIFIKDTITRNNGDLGIIITTSIGLVRASIDNCRSERNANEGFEAFTNSRVTINRSVASGNGSIGFLATSGVGKTAELSCEECVSSNNGSNGFVVNNDSTIRVSHSTATNNNNRGFFQDNTGVFESLSNNLVRGNTGGDTFGTITVITAK